MWHLQAGHLWFNLSLPFLPVPALVLTIHDVAHHPGDRLSMKTPQRVLDLAVARADDIIVHTAVAKRAVVERYGRDPAAVHVIPHVAIESPPREAPTKDEPIVLFFGRIWPYKGLDHLIRSAAADQRTRPTRGSSSPGTARTSALPRTHAGSLALRRHQRVRLDRAAQEALRGSSGRGLAVRRSVAERRGTDRVRLSKACGGHRRRRTPEMVEDGRTGLVVAPRDARALADAVSRLLENPELARQMGAAGLRKLEREWSPATVAEQTMRVYERSSHHTATRASSTYNTAGAGRVRRNSCSQTTRSRRTSCCGSSSRSSCGCATSRRSTFALPDAEHPVELARLQQPGG